MKKAIVLLALCLCGLVCSGCSDEFGSLSILLSYRIDTETESAEMGIVDNVYYVQIDGNIFQDPLSTSDKRSFHWVTGKALETRRDFKDTVEFEIVYESGKKVCVTASVSIPYLHDDKWYEFPIVFQNDKGDVYSGEFSYRFTRSI